MEHQNHNKLTQSTTSQPLKKLITKLLLSVSVFSFIISYSSWCSFFLHYLRFYLVAFPWQLLSHALDKSYIFLIFNGILVFVAKTSSLQRKTDDDDDDDFQASSKIEDSLLEKGDLIESTKPQEDVAGHGGGYENKNPESDVGNNVYSSYSGSCTEKREKGRIDEEDLKEEQIENERLIIVKDDEVLEPQKEYVHMHGEEEDDEEGKEEQIATYILGDDDHDHDEKDFDNDLCMIEDEEKEKDFEQGKGEGRNIELLSTEELNKKFEDFIRRMREDLRIEAQQQLVMVK